MSFVSPKNWRAEMLRVAEAQDASFGETLTIVPCDRRPNMSAKPDFAHKVTLTGIFSWQARDVTVSTSGGLPPVSTRDPWCSITRTLLPWAPRAGDLIHRECDGTTWEITKVHSNGVHRVDFDLVQMGLARQ